MGYHGWRYSQSTIHPLPHLHNKSGMKQINNYSSTLIKVYLSWITWINYYNICMWGIHTESALY